MHTPGEPGPGPSAVPSVPLHGPVDVVDDSLEGLQSAFAALSVEEVDTNPVKRKSEREKDAGESMADKGVDHGHDPVSESTFEGAPSASGLHASPSPTTNTLPTPRMPTRITVMADSDGSPQRDDRHHRWSRSRSPVSPEWTGETPAEREERRLAEAAVLVGPPPPARSLSQPR